jgi:hypothetical protein
METSRNYRILVLLSLIVAATILTTHSLAANAAIPPECQQLDKQIRQGTPLSQVLDPDHNAVIGPGAPGGVYVDDKIPPELGRIEIQPGGTLSVPDSVIDVKIGAIVVGGKFQVGTSACPIGTLNAGNEVIVRFVGERPQNVDRTADDCDNPANFKKGLQVAKGGSVSLYGAKGVPRYDSAGVRKPGSGISWTHLSKAAGPAFDPNYGLYDPNTKQYFTELDPDTKKPTGVKAPVSGEDISKSEDRLGIKLHVADDVTQGANPWRIGDWIVVATTSFSPFETEFVKISDIKKETTGGGSEISLETGLRHYHFGGLDPGLPSKDNYEDNEKTNFGVDERAEVGLISRNILFTAEVSSVEDHWGGEVLICPEFSEARMVGVELEKFGKDKLNSYPLHFHMLQDVQGKTTVKANSIHHSYNHGITVHSTSNLTVNDNVCARIVGHIFYEQVGDERNTLFQRNLGLGAMSNSFDIKDLHQTFHVKIKDDPPTYKDVRLDYDFKKLWWDGDYLVQTADFNYDGLNIPNDGNFTLPVHGSCKKPNSNPDAPTKPFFSQGVNVPLPWAPELTDANPAFPDPVKGCSDSAKGSRYYEAASGFWITNPTTRLIGNSIGGCQGMGMGYWYANPPSGPDAAKWNKFLPLGRFENNRAHACYYGFYNENAPGVTSDQFFPRIEVKDDKTGSILHRPVITTFDGVTATRNRYVGFWMRPEWIVVKDGRFASNRESVSLVTSGGLDGNAPGVWSMLQGSVLVGRSQNNVNFFGPCPYTDQAGPFTGDQFGCIDQNSVAESYEKYENGYPQVYWNWGGFYIYDGPVRIFRDRFVNFQKNIAKDGPDRLLTEYDQKVLAEKVQHLTNRSGIHEGDPALSWFKSNQSAYPNLTVSQDLSFMNVDFRHQIFTEKVNFGSFADGDKNTVIVDRDGSLTGLMVVDDTKVPVKGEFPVSLNNLTFNASANSVDECLSKGRQDQKLEGRATSLITSGNIATLEFEARNSFKKQGYKQNIEFRMDSVQYFDANKTPINPADRIMSLTGRDDHQVWEPKVASGYGYTIQAKKKTNLPESGIPSVINVGLTDAVKTNMKEDPFYVRVGICYTNKDGSHPQRPEDFVIKRGYKSWGKLEVWPGVGFKPNKDLLFKRYYTELRDDLYNNQTCHNLDGQVPDAISPNLDPVNGCPADGVTVPDEGGACPDKSKPVVYNGQDLCIYEKETLTSNGVNSLAALKDSQGKPVQDKFFYDSKTGMLFFYAMQDYDNPEAPSPLGSCVSVNGSTIDPACPKVHEGESYYACPRQGCVDYTVRLLDSATYDPGESTCDVRGYPPEVPDPSKVNLLATMNLANGTPKDIVKAELRKEVIKDDDNKTHVYYHRVAGAGTEPTCEETQVWQR